MDFLRRRWYLVGGVLAVLGIIALVIWHGQLSSFRVLLSISLITLFLHQLEEYWRPGGFPHMVNTAMFKSKQPDRYPLNTNTALIINVLFGWALYALALIFAEHTVWLATAAILVSAGNFVAHTFLFNVKGHTLYNPGMATAIVLFLPITVYYFVFIAQHGLAHTWSLIIGIVLGIIINYFGVLRMITLLAKYDSHYIFR